MSVREPDVVVAGGGLAGLACALHLSEAACRAAEAVAESLGRSSASGPGNTPSGDIR